MERTAKSHVESAFRALCGALDKRIAESYNDVGAWRLDYYQGWNIEEITNEQGGVRNPMGARRRTNREMYEACFFATDAVYIATGVIK